MEKLFDCDTKAWHLDFGSVPNHHRKRKCFGIFNHAEHWQFRSFTCSVNRPTLSNDRFLSIDSVILSHRRCHWDQEGSVLCGTGFQKMSTEIGNAAERRTLYEL